MNFPSLPTDNLWKFLVVACIAFQMYYWYNITGIGGTNQLISIRNKLAAYSTLAEYIGEKKKGLLFMAELSRGLEEDAPKAVIQQRFSDIAADCPPFMNGLFILCQLRDTSTLLLNKRLEDMAENIFRSEDELLRIKVTKEEMGMYNLLRGGWLSVVQFVLMGFSLFVLMTIWNRRTQRHQDRLLELQVRDLEKKLAMQQH